MTAQSTTVSRPSLALTLARFREVGITVFIVILVIAITIQSPEFLTIDNLTNILLDISILVIVALAEAMVIITRGIDLSVGSMVGLVAMMVAFIAKQYPDVSVFLIILLGLVLGCVLGAFNGLVITYGGVPPIIATLGTLSAYRGLVFLYSNGTWINPFELPKSFKLLAKDTPLFLPNMVIVAIVMAIIAYVFLHHTRVGRDIFAVGSNPDAAQLAGIRKQRTTFMVYVISGLACGLAAVLWASRFEAAQTNTADTLMLQVVSAAVVGGVSINGGVGTIPGVLLGALLLGIIGNALILSRISPFWQLAAQGLLILAAVVMDNLILQQTQRTSR